LTALVLMSSAAYADQFDSRRLERLRSLIATVEPVHVEDLNELPRHALAEVTVLLTGWGAPLLDQRRLRLLPRLTAVLHCAGSVKEVVTPALWERGISVSSAAEVNAIPVAEFTFAAILMAGKKAPFLAADARRSRTDWSYRHGRGKLSNLGLTIGIVGFSRVGRRVVERVQQLEDVTCLVADPFADPSEVADMGAKLATLDEMLRRLDVLSIHAPELPSTRHLIGALELAQLPDHATVINTARGSLVDTEALERECSTGRLNAILDVTDPEPLPAESALYDLANVMVTPHIAGSLDSETRRMTDAALEELERLEAKTPLRYEVREADLTVIA
jgi:phosphoglycerate dehydrogenase-like enzyme